MRRIIATEFASLDGWMDEPGEWTFPFWSDELGQLKQAEVFAVDAMILGRTTYDGFSKAWPSVTDEVGFADRFNAMPKHVASRTRTGFDWNATHLAGDLVAAVTELKAGEGGDIMLAGSSSIFHQLLAAGLVDEIHIQLYPVVLAGKVPLFDGLPKTVLTLTETQTFPSGVLGLTYLPTNPATPAGPAAAATEKD